MCGLRKINKKIEEINIDLDEMSKRTKIEKKAIKLIEECRFDEAIELLKKI